MLRYWEDELRLTIPRNEMGHRYYTKENIRQFWLIKNLKRQGYPMDAIRAILHGEGARYFYHTSAATQADRRKGRQTPQETAGNRIHPKRDMEAARENPGIEHILSAIPSTGDSDHVLRDVQVTDHRDVTEAYNSAVQKVAGESVTEAYNSAGKDMRMRQFRELVSQIVADSIAQNKVALSKAISGEVRELVIKEIDYQLRTRQERQENTIDPSKVIGGPIHTGLWATNPKRLQRRERKKLERELRKQAKREQSVR